MKKKYLLKLIKHKGNCWDAYMSCHLCMFRSATMSQGCNAGPNRRKAELHKVVYKVCVEVFVKRYGKAELVGELI